MAPRGLADWRGLSGTGAAQKTDIARLARPFVGAALCCEEAGTSNRDALSVRASSQHKAAPTGPC